VARQQLPPQIKKRRVTDRATGRPSVRYELIADVGSSPETGRRQQVRRRFRTEREARDELARITGEAAAGLFVPQSKTTVEQLCTAYLASRHNLRATSLAKLQYDLAPLRERYGDLPVQSLAKNHLDALVADLVAGGTNTAKGRKRRPWSPTAVNKVITSARQMLADAQAQGLIVRNVALLVRLVTVPHQEVDTYTDAEVNQILASLSGDRLAHAWELALAGLRRGEIAGLRWDDVDLEAKTLAIVQGRVHAGDKVVEGDPKSAASRRVLPIPDRLVAVLKAAKARLAGERLQLGPAFRSGDYVVSNEIGDPYHPQTLSRYWAKAMKRAGVRHIKLHGGRHTCATLMHFDGVMPVVVADWIGHDDANLTIKLYTHSQPDALRAAGETLNRVVTTCDIEAQ